MTGAVRAVAWLAPLIVLVCVVARLVFPEVYFSVLTARESSVVEALAPLAGAAAAVVGALAFVASRGKTRRVVSIGILCLALAGFYAAGEELSWGQHVFHFATPGWWESINFQGETNLHNTTGALEGIFLTLPHNGMVVFTLVVGLALPAWARVRHPRVLQTGWPRAVLARPVVYAPAAITATAVYFLRKLMRASGLHYGQPDYVAITELVEALFLLFLLSYLTSVLVYFRSLPAAPDTVAPRAGPTVEDVPRGRT